jgi:DNA-binding PadR family transcriptional regulator
MPDPRDLLPLPPHDFHVLLSLTEAPRHAYGLSAAVAVAEDQRGTVRLEIGSLYRILARLTAQGLIADFEPPAGSEGHEARRRYYRVTPFGKKVASAEASRLEAVLREARKHKLLPSSGSR